MLIGEFFHSLDEKGRIIIPSKIRQDLGSSFILTKGLDGCLFAYSKEDWEHFQSKLASLPTGNKEARAFQRFFFSGAQEVSYDKQGRIVIPQNLRDFADFIKDVVIIGVSNRLEFWAFEKWQNYTEDADINVEDIAENMGMLGI